MPSLMPFTAPPRRELTPFEQRIAATLEGGVWLGVGWLLLQSGATGMVVIAIMAALALVGFPEATAWYANRFGPRTGLSSWSRPLPLVGPSRGRAGRWFGASARPGLGFT